MKHNIYHYQLQEGFDLDNSSTHFFIIPVLMLTLGKYLPYALGT